MSKHIDAALAAIDKVLQERPGNDDGPEATAVPDEEPSVASDSGLLVPRNAE